MLKKILFFTIVLIGLVFIDQAFKFYAPSFSKIHFNQGFIFGSLSQIPKLVRVVTITALGSVILASFFLGLLLISYTPLIWGITFVGGGMIGNLLDRARLSKTIDFINIGSFSFNIADCFLWIGAFFIFYLMFFKHREIWFPKDQRGKKLIDPKEQIPLAIPMVLSCLGISFILSFFSYAYFNTQVRFQHSTIMTYYVLCIFLLTCIFSLISFVVGIYNSHRIIGPIKALESYTEKLLNNEEIELKLRDQDYLKSIESLAEKIKKLQKSKNV